MRVALSFSAVLFLSVLVLADNPTHLGESPPALSFGAPANGSPPAKSVADLKGDVVFLVWFRTSCPGCIAVLPGLDKIDKKYDRPDVHVVGLTNDSVDLIRRYLVHESVGRKLGFPMMVRNNGNYGVSQLPMGYVIGRDGKVLWAGNPNASYAKALAEAVAGVDPAVAKAGKKARKAMDLVYRRQYAKALTAAAKLEGEAGEYVKGRVATYFARRTAEADRHLATGDLHAACETLESALEEFKGSEHEKVAAAKLASLKGRPDFEEACGRWKKLSAMWAQARTGKAPALKSVAARLRPLVEKSGDPKFTAAAKALIAVAEKPWSMKDAADFGGGCGVR